MAFRDDLAAHTARHDALAAEIAEKTRELDDVRRSLEHARARARLPVLDEIRIAAPCSASWDHMPGDDRVRQCGDCNETVYHLSLMTRAEAEALLVEKHGQLCARYFQRSDGTILTADCAVGVRRRRRRRVVAAGVALVAGSASAVGYHAHRVPADTRTFQGSIGAAELPIAEHPEKPR